MIPPLVSFDLAKNQLRMTSNDLDSEIDSKIRLATSIVMNHCKLTDVPSSWISDVEPAADTESDELILVTTNASPPETLYIRVPGNLQAAILIVLEGLFNGVDSKSELLSPTVISLLTPFRDPTMA